MRHLRIVGNEISKPKRRAGGRVNLTEAQVKRVRAAITVLLRAYGSYSCLAEVAGISAGTLHKYHSRRPGMNIAVCIARAAGVPVERLLDEPLGSIRKCEARGSLKRAS